MSEQAQPGWKRVDGQLFRQKNDGTWWWQASDERWYPEESHPSFRLPPPPPPLPPAGDPVYDPSSGSKPDQKMGAWLLLAGGVAAAIGSFMSWATLSAPLIGTVSKKGIDGDGKFTLILAVLIAIPGLAALTSSKAVRRGLVLIPIALLAALAAFEYSDVSDIVSEANTEESLVASIGTGLYLIAAGVVSAIIGLIKLPPAVPD